MMSIRAFLAAAILVAAPMISLHAQSTRNDPRTWTGQPGPATSTAKPRSDVQNDSAFIRQALTGSVLEVRLGKLAQSKASNAAVKQFGQQMVTDHTRMQSQWATFSFRSGLPVKPTLDPTQEQSARQLEQLSGTAFDQAYMREMIQEHQHDQDLFQNQGARADAPEVRQMAAADLATIQQHLSTAQQVASQVGVNTNVATTRQSTAGGNVANPRARNNRDRDDLKVYLHEVADDHLMQVQLGQLAQRRAKNGEVKRLGRQIVEDFNKWQDRWTDLAKKQGMGFEPALGPMHRDLVDRVEKASNGNFDRTYLSTVVDNLQSMVSDLRNADRNARWQGVRNLADDELKVVQQHLAAARQQQEKLNNRASK